MSWHCSLPSSSPELLSEIQSLTRSSRRPPGSERFAELHQRKRRPTQRRRP